jgi:hypothetical protein
MAFDPPAGCDTARITVKAFYLGFGAGDGDQAAKSVIPEKRRSGPVSAAAITKLYSDLIEPLTLIGVVPVDLGTYRAQYNFTAKGSNKGDGVAIVRTTQIENLIALINALNGSCRFRRSAREAEAALG